jgi:hypothetical protein
MRNTKRAFVALCGSLVLSGTAFASGYEFSISASATDPFVNTSAPTNGIRNLYLWVTCVEDGLSAFEAGVSSNVSLLGFAVQNGVINAGNVTHLLLVVPGCPYGDGVDLLLGYWAVWDSGTEICLIPSTEGGILGAVDCQTFALTTDPVVQGFSSGTGAPCSSGTNGCPPLSGGNNGSFGT